jgi:hypothetical protein
MSIQGNFHCLIAALAIVVGYLVGGVLAVNCDKGCKSVEGWTSSGGGHCVAVRTGKHCNYHSMWVDGPDTSHSSSTPCQTYNADGNAEMWSCSNCAEVCTNTANNETREMLRPDPWSSGDCSGPYTVKRKGCPNDMP